MAQTPQSLKTMMLSVEHGNGVLGVLPRDVASVTIRTKKIIHVTKKTKDVLPVDNTPENRAQLSQRGWKLGEE